MQKDWNPVDSALQSLASRHWPAEHRYIEMEKRVMQAFEANKPAARQTARRLVIPAVGILLIGGAAFVAAGGLTMVRSWFVTTAVDGQIVDTRAVTPNADGSASFTVPVGPPREGGKTVALTLEGDGADGGAKTVNVTVDGENAQVEVKAGESGSGK